MNSIIIFLHFHKAGGTSINRAFKEENHRKHQPNLNGNPIKNGQIIKFWDYTQHKFNHFKGYLDCKNVNFVCLEWNYFKNYQELDYDRIELITCLRDPYQRFVSNVNFDFNLVTNQENNWEEFNQAEITLDHLGPPFKVNFNKFNYYVKMLNGFGDQPDIEITEEHLEIAKENLKKFKVIMILEKPKSFRLLRDYGVRNVKKAKVNPDRKDITLSEEEFRELNKYDYDLYKYAKELSKQQMKLHYLKYPPKNKKPKKAFEYVSKIDLEKSP